MGNGFHLTLMTFRQLTFPPLGPEDDDADKDGDVGEDDNENDNDNDNGDDGDGEENEEIDRIAVWRF